MSTPLLPQFIYYLTENHSDNACTSRISVITSLREILCNRTFAFKKKKGAGGGEQGRENMPRKSNPG